MTELNKLLQRFHASKSLLVKAFYGSLDSSLIQTCLRSGRAPLEWSLLGEGRHFQSYKLSNYDGLSLAVNIAKITFYGAEPILRQRWSADLKRVLQLDHPLVPPMEVFVDTNYFAYVQPCCELMAPQTSEIMMLMQDLEQNLKTLNLDMDDYPQLQLCREHPFLLDYSELKKLARGTFKF